MTLATLSLEDASPVFELTGEEVLFRQTYYSQWDFCAYRLHEDEHTLPAFSEPMAFGSVAHAANADIAGGADPLAVISDIETVAVRVLETEYEVPNWRDYIDADQWSEFLDELQVAVSVYAQYLKPIFKSDPPTIVEEKLMAKIGTSTTGRDIVLFGTPDLYINNILYDFKTSGKAWDESKPDFIVQAPLYYTLLYVHDLGWPDLARFLIYNRAKGDLEELDTEPTPVVVESALKRSVQRASSMELGILPASPSKEQYFKHRRGWYCNPKFCGNWNTCEYKFLNDSFDEHVEATIQWK